MRLFRYSLLAVLVTFPLSLGPRSAEGSLSFSFEGSDEGGTASGTMEFIPASGTYSLTVKINNNSPLLLDDFSGANSPGITGFGFDSSVPLPALLSWTLTADDSNGQMVTIGEGNPNSNMTKDWVMTAGVQGIQLDFFPTTGPGVSGALYNPAQSDPNSFAAPPIYFTEAILSVEFDPNDSVFVLDAHGFGPGGIDASPIMRFQNVGLGGEGSLKLGQVPEASSVIIWGLLGTIGVAFRRRRRVEAGENYDPLERAHHGSVEKPCFRASQQKQ